MNALTPSAKKTGTLRWLMRREYWENRGGFLYAPLIAGAASLLMSTVAVVLGLFAVRRAAESGSLHIGGESVRVNGLDLGMLTQSITPSDMADLARGMDLTLIVSSSWPFLVLNFVVFFYCLGALYDDRRDRSILFWKSLPLSDSQTVLSKVLSALVVAPVIATAAALVTMLLFMLMLSVVVLVHGGSPMTLIWGPASPLTLAAGFIVALPVYALWALPTAGWLLLCSAWAKSKPFLWAVMLPLFAGIMVSTMNLMQVFGGSSSWFWSHIVGRLLLGAFPGVDMLYRGERNELPAGMDSLAAMLAPDQVLRTFAMPDIWIGAAVGVIFILLAIRLRRRAGEI